jgi:phosphoglycolate phosphatase-like HAD superfamily hydrolase
VRADLVAIARAEARRRSGWDFGPESTVLVGDTPRDVAAAREAGVRIVAVPTGVVSEAELLASGPDVLVRDLTDRARFIAALDEALGYVSLEE